MPTDQRTIAHGGTDDASFRAYVAAVRAQLEAVGLVRTADTGQIDPATVARPTSNNVAAGIDVFRFDDDLQATHPVHIKIEYRTASGGTAGNVFTIRPTVGLGGTNGAGGFNIPNFVSSGFTPTDLSTSGALSSTDPCYCSADVTEEGRFWWYRHNAPSSASANQGFFVERTRDSSGAVLPIGVIFQYWSNTTCTFYFLSYSNNYKSMGSSTNHAINMSTSGQPSTVGGSELAVAPFIYCYAGKWYQLSHLYGANADFTPLAPVTIERFGEDQVYMIFGNVTNHVHVMGSTGTIQMLRYD